MKKEVKRRVIVSTLSSLAAVGVTAMVYTKRVKQVHHQNSLSHIKQMDNPLSPFSYLNIEQEEDNDLGFC
jgi:hypothetical protein